MAGVFWPPPPRFASQCSFHSTFFPFLPSSSYPFLPFFPSILQVSQVFKSLFRWFKSLVHSSFKSFLHPSNHVHSLLSLGKSRFQFVPMATSSIHVHPFLPSCLPSIHYPPFSPSFNSISPSFLPLQTSTLPFLHTSCLSSGWSNTVVFVDSLSSKQRAVLWPGHHSYLVKQFR